MEVLSKSILGEARAEIEQLQQEAQERAKSIRQRADEDAARERRLILDQASEEVRRLRGQASATAQMKARALELEHREHLLDMVFEAVGKRLPDVAGRQDYGEIALRLSREALAQLRTQVAELRLDQTAQKLLSKSILEQLAKETGVKLTLGGTLEKGTGVVAQSPDGHLQFDNTLETRLQRMQSVMRSTVHRILMGEAE